MTTPGDALAAEIERRVLRITLGSCLRDEDSLPDRDSRRDEDGRGHRHGDSLRLSLAETFAREMVRDPAQFGRDLAWMPRTWEVAQAVAQAREIVAQQRGGQRRAPAPAQPLVSGPQPPAAPLPRWQVLHPMLSQAGLRERLGLQGALHSAPSAPAVPSAPQPPAPRAGRQPRRRSRGPRYGRG